MFLPDKFYMYLDMDAGTLQFGSDINYYGTAHAGIPKNYKPLYPMVGIHEPGCAVTMVYIGEGMYISLNINESMSIICILV